MAFLVLCVVVVVGISTVIDDRGHLSSPRPAGGQSQQGTNPADRWVTSERLNRRTCPSVDCGVVGWLMHRERAQVFETRDAWARVSKYYDAACRDGRSTFVDTGNAACTPENGIENGRLAEWVAAEYLSETRPPEPGTGATGVEGLVAGSDDFTRHRAAFVQAAKELMQDGRCTAEDLRRNGGWVKSTRHGDAPVYFTYCGDTTTERRVYLDAVTGRIF